MGWAEELDEAFAGCSDAVKRVLPYLWRDRHWQMADRNPTENWIEARIVLLGDAAHPPLQYLAQGACMAIEDAACLSTQALDFVTTLGPGKGWDQAMESDRSQRAPRTARIQTTARTWGEVWHVEGVARTLRNELMTQRDTDSYASPTGCTAIRAEQPTALTVAADAEGDVDRAHTSTDRACPRLPEGEGAKARSCRGTPAYPRARCAPVLPLPTLALRGDHGVLQPKHIASLTSAWLRSSGHVPTGGAVRHADSRLR